MGMSREMRDFIDRRQRENPHIPSRSGRHCNLYTKKYVRTPKKHVLLAVQKRTRKANRKKNK